MSNGSVIVDGMKGLGDNIFQRAFVKSLARGEDVYLQTPFPELYEDLPRVRFIKMETPLRTQTKNLARQPRSRWSTPPAGARRVKVGYGSIELRTGSMIAAMQRCFGVAPESWDLPGGLPRFPSADRPIAVIRPVTVRKEWRNEARNPLPQYIAAVAAELMVDHFVVSVADLAEGAEWLSGEAPPAHHRFHFGELAASELLGLVATAAVVIGAVGWLVPAAIAARTPAFILLGGQGGHNHPSRISDPRMDLSRMRFAVPDRYCMCESMKHDCAKTNSRLHEQWATFRSEVLGT